MLIKSLDFRWVSMVLAALTIAGSYSFIADSIAYEQWQSDRVFFAFLEVVLACAIVVASFVRPRIVFILCWVFMAVVLIEILAVFSGYSGRSVEPKLAQEGPLTLRLINRVWSYHPFMLALVFLMLFFRHKSKQ